MTRDSQTACPSDEVLGTLIAGKLTGVRRENAERHVAGCGACLDVVAAALPARMPSIESRQPGARDVPSRRAPWRRWAVAASVLIVAGTSLAVAIGNPLERLRPGIALLATRWLGTAVRMDALAVRLGPSGTFVVTLRNVHLGRNPGLFQADEVGVTVALAAPLFSESALREIHLVGPVVEVGRPETLGALVSARGREQVATLLAETDRVEVTDGRVVVRGAAGDTVSIDHVIGAIERNDAGAKIALQGRLGDGTVDVVGTVADDGSRMALTLAGRGVDAAAIPIVATRVRGSGDLRVDVTGGGDGLRVGGRIALRHGHVVGGGAMGFVDDEATRAALVDVLPALGGDDLPFDEARASFAWGHGTWRLPRFFLTQGDTVVGGRLRLALGGELTGHGAVRLPPAPTSRLDARVPALARYRDETGAATLPFKVTGSLTGPRVTFGRP